MLDKTAQSSVCLVVCGGIAAYKKQYKSYENKYSMYRKN